MLFSNWLLQYKSLENGFYSFHTLLGDQDTLQLSYFPLENGPIFIFLFTQKKSEKSEKNK